MKNNTAISTVTAVLGELIHNALGVPFPHVEIKFGRPEGNESHSAPVVHLYLYMVRPNLGLSNMDLPTRNSDGKLVHIPNMALDLYYMISFFGEDNKLVPQRMMEQTICTLLAHPGFSKEGIKDFIKNKEAFPWLTQSGLAEQAESIKFSPVFLNTEEFSKLWSVFLQVPHRLFLTYQATVVIVKPILPYKEALPVRKRENYSPPGGHPKIKSISPEVLDVEKADQKKKPRAIMITGENLWYEESYEEKENGFIRNKTEFFWKTDVVFGEFTAPVKKHTPTMIEVYVSDQMPAGILPVRIFHRKLKKRKGEPDQEIESVGSNTMEFILRPTVKLPESLFKGKPSGGIKGNKFKNPIRITVTTSSIIYNPWEVELFLNEIVVNGEKPAAYSFPAEEILDSPKTQGTTFLFSINDLFIKSGDYLARIRFAHNPLAESQLKTDKTGRYTGPAVKIT